MLPFGLAFLWERHIGRISDSRQIAGETHLQVLGEITTLPARSLIPGRRSSDRMLRERVTFEESVDALARWTHSVIQRA